LILYLGLKNGGYRNLWQFQLEKTYSKLSNLGYLRVQVPYFQTNFLHHISCTALHSFGEPFREYSAIKRAPSNRTSIYSLRIVATVATSS
jgi:hypothetical protein